MKQAMPCWLLIVYYHTKFGLTAASKNTSTCTVPAAMQLIILLFVTIQYHFNMSCTTHSEPNPYTLITLAYPVLVYPTSNCLLQNNCQKPLQCNWLHQLKVRMPPNLPSPASPTSSYRLLVNTDVGMILMYSIPATRYKRENHLPPQSKTNKTQTTNKHSLNLQKDESAIYV